ncbi:MAG: hypothetical protein KatS3mg105_2466 [Gemmatales bacterium]|nr:MAG: hypothetical protein KatS3mg105_2466 [Gemmatales bacterium]
MLYRLFSVWCLVVPAVPATSAELTPDTPCQAQRSEPITHTVDFSVVVTPPAGCKVLKVWLPIPPSDRTQQIVEKSRFSTFPMRVREIIAVEPVFGNRFAYFEFHHPKGGQIIRHRFKIKVWNLNWNLDPSKVLNVVKWPPSFDVYRTPERIRNQEEFDKVIQSIVPRRSHPTKDLFRVMDWIDQNLVYDHRQASLRADAGHAFIERRGHCSDYHGLCTAMARALGYPTRVTYGLSLYPKNSPSHCKMEAYLPPYGWISFDLSETQKLVASIRTNDKLDEATKVRLIEAARDRLKKGFRENSWLLMTRGTNYQLAPKAVAPVSVVRTAYIEADGVPLPDPRPSQSQQPPVFLDDGG